MRHLLALLLSIIMFAASALFLLLAIFDFSDHADIGRLGLMAMVYVPFIGLLSRWRRKLRRKMPPRYWKRPKAPQVQLELPKVSVAPSSPRPAAAHKLAAPPLAVAVPLTNSASPSSLPAKLRKFVEKGDQAIQQISVTVVTPEKTDDVSRGRFIPAKGRL